MDYIEKAVHRLLEVEPVQDGRQEIATPEEDIEYRQTRVLSVDQNLLREKRVLVEGTPQHVVNAYKVLRTRVLQRMEQNGWKTLAVTSCGVDEGKTLTAINLSISLAMKLEYTVLLVDLDYRRPSVHSYFGFKPEFGLSDYFLEGVSLSDILVNTGIKRLVVLPEREKGRDISEQLGSPRMTALVDELKSRYPSRLVIFDMPPVLLGDDVLGFSRIADTTLLVVEEGKTTFDQLDRVSELLKDVNWLGSVLNKSRWSHDTETYGYS